ncbi:serine/threonine-protein kinase [Catenulispora pinisilvae]|uniref:serine/threonine-protein kinase n=1 Tax=Catenulispora pinisilvae TaxID=2705253 RepID=UPI0018917ADD|nr:serine/threonine-protein kinase [Catenulispora pinisilvae]
MELAPGMALADRYRLVERIGRGGFGEVFRAYDESLSRAVAIKTLRATEASEAAGKAFLSRFEREARVMASLRHPSIVTVHDRGVHEGVAYVVMELLSGPDLGTVQQQRRVLPAAEVMGYAAQAASAVQYLHGLSEPVVHRDLKPANLVLDDGAVKLCDFGIAAVLAPELTRMTQAGQLMGTPIFAAPEQVRGETASPTWDVFSLGTVLYSLFAGGSPFFAGPDMQESLRRVQFEQPRPLSSWRGDIPAQLSPLVAAMMDKQADRRPPAAFVAQELAAMRDSMNALNAAGSAQLGGAPLGARARGMATPPVPDPATMAEQRIQDAERLLNGGRYADADHDFAEAVKLMKAANRGSDRLVLLAEFGRVRAGYARGDGAASAIRLLRLTDRAEAVLDPSDDFIQTLHRFQAMRR